VRRQRHERQAGRQSPDPLEFDRIVNAVPGSPAPGGGLLEFHRHGARTLTASAICSLLDALSRKATAPPWDR